MLPSKNNFPGNHYFAEITANKGSDVTSPLSYDFYE